jgi:2-amino-4-hydroxy-6-hydroxymethyldihydropteridine diphosphokinase
MLLFGEQCISSSRLSVPHPEMKNRAFVLAPLVELSPELTMPDGTSLQQLLNQCPIDDLTCLEP